MTALVAATKPGQGQCWCRHRHSADREAVNLGDIEHDKAPKQADRPFLLVIGLGEPQFSGEDNGRAALALADLCTSRLRLPIGEPGMGGIVLGLGRAPEDRDVDATVFAAGDSVVRQHTADAAGTPWPGPRHGSGFQLGDDIAGHRGIELAHVHGSPPQ
jgi:hypothetical protein